MLDNENSNGGKKTIFGIPCDGCTNRAEIMGAGNWRMDALILLMAGVIAAGIIIMKYTSITAE